MQGAAIMSKRQDLDITLLTEHDAWNGCEGEHLGLPLLIRYRSQLSRSVDLSNHPYLVIIGWNYSDHPSGMPSLEESACMNRLEGELVNELERDALGVLAGCRHNWWCPPVGVLHDGCGQVL